MITKPVVNALRLDDLDIDAIAAEVDGLVQGHVERLMTALSLELPAPSAPTAIYTAVQRLGAYAKTGDLGDWPSASAAADAINVVMAALYSCAGEPAGSDAVDIDHVDPDSPIGHVLLAAHARVLLARRGSPGLTPREMSVLAGLSSAHVRLAGRAGKLTITDGRTPRAEARDWLRSRGVKGLTGRTEREVEAEISPPELARALRGIALHPVLRDALVEYAKKPGLGRMSVADWRIAIESLGRGLRGSIVSRTR